MWSIPGELPCARYHTCHRGPHMGTVAEAPAQGLGHSCHAEVLQASLCSYNPCFPISSFLFPT